MSVNKARTNAVGITGRSGSGKTFLALNLMSYLQRTHSAGILSFDDYYRRKEELPEEPNFDDPSSLDVELFISHIKCLLEERVPIDKPTYCFKTHSRLEATERIEPVDILIIEGIFAMHEDIKPYTSLHIYVETEADMCLQRRIERDIAERGRTKECATYQWNSQVEPAAYKHIVPQKLNAHVVVQGTDSFEQQLASILPHLPTSRK